MSISPYKRYKDSEVEWLSDVPQEWKIRRVKRLFEIKKRISGVEGYDVLSITQQGIKVKDTESGDGQLSMDYSKYQFVEVGDFAMNHMDLLTGYVDISSVFGVTSPDYRVFSIRNPKECFDRYYLYLFQAGYKNKIFYAFGQGSSQLGRWRFPTEQFNSFELPCPSIQEQKQIAAFLDYETTKIDLLLSEQQRLIELLNLKRQAVISHAVTKGLNPVVPMKASGIAWLGDVPEHWKVIRLRFLCQIETGDADTSDATSEGEYPFFVRSSLVEKIGRYTHDCEAVLTAGDGAGVGKVFHYFKGKFCAHQRVYIFRDFREINGCFFYHYMKELFQQVVLEGTAKSTVDSLRRPMIADFWMVVPPLIEQSSINLFIEEQIKVIEQLIAEAQKAILLLQERRTALIFAAVTGKIDVRGFVADH